MFLFYFDEKVIDAVCSITLLAQGKKKSSQFNQTCLSITISGDSVESRYTGMVVRETEYNCVVFNGAGNTIKSTRLRSPKSVPFQLCPPHVASMQNPTR